MSNISPAIIVKIFLPIIAVVIFQINTKGQNITFQAAFTEFCVNIKIFTFIYMLIHNLSIVDAFSFKSINIIFDKAA